MYSFSISNSYAFTVGFLLFINSLLVIKLKKTEGFGKDEKWIINLINYCSACAVGDAACIFFAGRVSKISFFILNTLFFISFTGAMFSLFRYTFGRYVHPTKVGNTLKWGISIPFILVILLAISSYWTELIFYIDDDGIYHRGKYYNLFFIIGFSYLLGMFAISLFHYITNRKTDKKAIQPLMFTIPTLIGPVLQLFFPGFPVTNMGLTVTLLIIFINNQEIIINRGITNTKLMAALSLDYESVIVVDYDKETFYVLRTSRNNGKLNLSTTEHPYQAVVSRIINEYVIADERDAFFQFLEVNAMKDRIEKQKSFSYRYAIESDETGHYIYEMHFVRIGENPKKHVVVVGTKCIDDILKLEREQGQYNAALLHDCKFFYEFDVTDGRVGNNFRTNDEYDPFYGLEITFPIRYDDFNKLRTDELGMQAVSDKERDYWTCKGLEEAFDSGKRTVEIHYMSKKLNRFWTATIILTEDSTNHHLHAVYICKDVTEVIEHEKKYQMTLETTLAEAKRASAAKSEFLSRMSHDIRTPLNGIIGLMDINDMHKDEAELVQANRAKARIAANHLLSLINDVLDMSKLEDDKTVLLNEPVELLSLCEESLTICNIRAKEMGITLHHDNGENLVDCHVLGSGLHIKQIFMNLLNNGVKYNKPGGDLYCTSSVLKRDEDTITVCFEIADTGIGMSKEYLEHIYEPFSQEKNDARSRYQGTGMGMAIVKALVDKMGGSIEVESEQNVGTKFKVILPLKINHDYVEEKESGLIENSISISGQNILLVEDNDLNREIAQCILEDFGGIVTTAVNGQEAYDIFINKPAGTFDVVLMDIMMPIMDGYEATRKIRQSDKADAAEIPIVAMTANAFEEDKRNALLAGMNEHVSKPFEITELMKTLTRLIAKES